MTATNTNQNQTNRKIFSLKRLIVSRTRLAKPNPDSSCAEVDRQRALNDVLVHTRLVTNLEFAQRDAWKTFRVAPVLAAYQPLNDMYAVHMVVDLQEGIEHEQLTDGVAEVQ